jgi:hypothetical protein
MLWFGSQNMLISLVFDANEMEWSILFQWSTDL